MKYRKKPVVIEAVQFWNGDVKNTIPECLKFCDNHATLVAIGRVLVIDTLEGTMFASDGDWIIKGIKGEFYPCKPDIFKATYEPVKDGAE